MKYEKFAPLIVIGIIGLAALPFIVNRGSQKPTTENVPVQAAASVKPEVPLFELPTPTGETIALRDLLSKNKAVLINFWFNG